MIINLGWVFILLIAHIFLFILIRFMYKVWKRRSSRNSLQFELSEPAPSPSPSPSPTPRIEGYGEFVDEAV